MKRILAISLVVLAALVSCQKEDHAVNQMITYYPEITLTGGNTVAHQLGTPWSDPGVKAVLQGDDVTSQLDIVHDVDPDNSGIYTVTYSFTNKDGFTRSTARTVVVYDVANASQIDISGTYNTKLVEDSDGWSPSTTTPIKIVTGPGAGLFYINDLFCGYWESGRGYGPAYAFKALVQLNLDNTIDILSVTNAWEGSYHSTQLDGCYYDPKTGDVVMHWAWDAWGDSFVCTYSK